MKYTVRYNQSRKTYTVREYDEKGKLVAKYRSYPQDKNSFGIITENDIKALLKNNEFYLITK